MTREATRDERWSRWIWAGLVLLALSPFVAYGGAYAYVRSTHQLVHYAGGFIARPNAMHGLGYTTWELAFLPATFVEESIRGWLDPSW